MSTDSRREVERMARVIAADVYALENTTVNSLLPSLLAAREELQRALTNWLRKVDGRERFTAQQLRRGLVAIEAALEEIARMRPEFEARIRGAAAQGASLAAGHLREELIRFGQAFGESIRPTQVSTAAIIAHTRNEIIPRIRTSSARYVEAVREDMRHQLKIGLAAGETFEQMTNRLRRLGGPRGLVALRGIVGEPGAHVEEIAEGLFNRYRHWAERVVRTEVMNAYNVEHAAAIDLANQDLDDDEEPLQLRWDATPDRRLCPICRGLDGKIVDVGKKFPGGHERPPAHPNCRCVAIAWHPSWGGLSGELAPPKVEKRASSKKASPPQRQLPGIPGPKPKKQPKPPAAKKAPKAPKAPKLQPAPRPSPPTPPTPPARPAPAAPPAPPAAPPSTPKKQKNAMRSSTPAGRRAMEQRTITNTRALSTEGVRSGVNGSFIAELDDGTQAMWKPITGESSGLRRNISAGTYYQREAAASKVAQQLGVADLLPATVTTQHQGVPGSLQAWAHGAKSLKRHAPEFDQDSSERMRVFDFIVGNTDRHYGNVMQLEEQGRSRCRLIDNGLCFPRGTPQRFIQPWDNIAKDRELLESTRDQIAAVNLRKLAKTLLDANIEEDAVAHTLYRARFLQLRPEALEVPANHSAESTWDDVARTAHTRLPAADKTKIDKLISRLRKNSP